MFLRATEAAVAQLKDSQVVFMLERLNEGSSDVPEPIIIRSRELNFRVDLSDIKPVGEEASQDSDPKTLTCKNFCLKSKSSQTVISVEVKESICSSLLHTLHVGGMWEFKGFHLYLGDCLALLSSSTVTDALSFVFPEFFFFLECRHNPSECSV